ncbi:MAG: RNA polymerase sigma factor [Myxococcota bacterium]
MVEAKPSAAAEPRNETDGCDESSEGASHPSQIVSLAARILSSDSPTSEVVVCAGAVARMDVEQRPLREGARIAVVVEPEELVLRCQAGNREAFNELFNRHRSDVARLVQRLLGGHGDIDDTVQEVFLQVHRSLKDFRFGSRFSTWLYRVTVNVVLMQRRAARSRPKLVETPEGLVPEDAGLSPEEQTARRRRVAAFYRLLDRLSDKKRVAYVLHELEGLSPSEIAQTVGAPVLTVRTRLFYARRELAEMLREEPSLNGVARELCESDPPPSPEPHKEPA